MKLAKKVLVAAAVSFSASLVLSAHAADDDSFAPGGTAIDHSTVK